MAAALAYSAPRSRLTAVMSGRCSIQAAAVSARRKGAQIHDMVSFQIQQDRAEALTTPKREVINP